MKTILEEILVKIENLNSSRFEKGLTAISTDNTDEELQEILEKYFMEDYEAGIDICSWEFLEENFGGEYLLIRDAEAGLFRNTKKSDVEL